MGVSLKDPAQTKKTPRSLTPPKHKGVMLLSVDFEGVGPKLQAGRGAPSGHPTL